MKGSRPVETCMNTRAARQLEPDLKTPSCDHWTTTGLEVLVLCIPRFHQNFMAVYHYDPKVGTLEIKLGVLKFKIQDPTARGDKFQTLTLDRSRLFELRHVTRVRIRFGLLYHEQLPRLLRDILSP
jgi:hypothetical protein